MQSLHRSHRLLLAHGRTFASGGILGRVNKFFKGSEDDKGVKPADVDGESPGLGGRSLAVSPCGVRISWSDGCRPV